MKDCNSFEEEAIKFEDDLKKKIGDTEEILDLETNSDEPIKYIFRKKNIKFSGRAYLEEYSEFNFTNCIIHDKLEFGDEFSLPKGNLIKDNLFIEKSIFNEEFIFLGEKGFDCDVTFKNTYFRKKVSFDSMSFKKKVSFDETIFLEDVVFNNCTFESFLHFRGIKVKGSLIFRRCKFTNEFNIGRRHGIDSIIYDKLIIDNCNKGFKSKRLALPSKIIVKTGVEWLNMRDCHLSYYDRYFNMYLNQAPKVIYKNCDISSIKPQHSLTDINTQITLIDCNVLGTTNLSNRKILKPISFENCNFEKEVTFQNTIFYNCTDFKDCTFNKEVSFKLTEYIVNEQKEYHLKNCSFENSTFKENANFYSRNFIKANFDQVKFEKLADFHSTVFHSPICFYQTEFQNTCIFGKAIFKEVLVFAYTRVSLNLSFHYAQIERGLNLAYINFVDKGNLELFEMELNEFDSYPIKEIGYFDGIKEKRWSQISHKEKRETFRLLKHQAIQHNNRILALENNAKEMEAHTLCVKEKGTSILYSDYSNIETSRFVRFTNNIIRNSQTKGSYSLLAIVLVLINQLFHIPAILFNLKLNQDLLVLRFNQVTNNHGSDWKRGINFTIVVSGMFFIIYWFSLESTPIEFNLNASFKDTWKSLGIVFSYWAHFTNPTHWTTFMKEYKGEWSVFIDIISRVFIGVGLFQTIQAFRKYGRF